MRPPTDVLIVVDMQNDFCRGGSLAVTFGDEIVPTVNFLAASFRDVVLTQDWHPSGHCSFASAARAGDVSEERLWPDHCVQGTSGAALHPELDIPHAGLIIRKGLCRWRDSYSAFRENDRGTMTGLAGYLRERGFTRVFVAGLAFDFCVRYTAEDARLMGFDAVVIEDACRAIDTGGSLDAARDSFAERGVELRRQALLANFG